MSSLRAVLLLLVLIAIAPVFVVITLASLSEQQGRLDRSEAALRSLVELSAAHQEQFIESARQILTAIAHAPPVYGDDLQACSRYLNSLRDKYPRYANFGLLDAQGALTCRAVPGSVPLNMADRDYFKRALQSRDFVVGEFVMGRATGRPSLVFALPVYRQDSSLRGVLFVALDLARTGEKLRQVAVGQDVTLLVTDARAVVLAAAGRSPVAVGAPVTDAFLRQRILARAASVTSAEGAEGQQWLYAVRPAGDGPQGGLFVSAFVSRSDVLAQSMQRLGWQLGAIALIAVIAATVAWVFGDRVLAQPIRRLLERTVQRESAMDEMLGQKNLLESVLESMAEGVLVVDPQGHFLHLNAAALRIVPGLRELGRQDAPLAVPAEHWGLFHIDGQRPLLPEERPLVRAIHGESVDEFRYMIRGPLAGGAQIIVQATSRPVYAPDARAAGAVMIFADVTQSWHAQRALEESEKRYRSLFESNPHPMWVFDTRTLAFITVNDAAIAHYGYSREEFLGMTIRDIRPTEDVATLEAVLRDLDPDLGDPRLWRHRCKDGRIIDVEVSTHTLEFDGRPARIVLAHDITQRLQAQQALSHLNDTLERRVVERTRELAMANKELESFSYSVSHDLRAPLQVIDGFSRALLSGHADSINTQGAHYLNRIRENTHQMSQLIDDLLSLAKVTRADIHAQPCNLSLRARQIVDSLRLRNPERQVQVAIDEDMRCVCDSRLLGIVLENLIVNAWKFTAKTPQARLHIGREQDAHGNPVFFVADNGAGFDMNYADKLFKAFQRLHASVEFEGTGIGLATVHRIITRHGGSVWAQAQPGQGATFKFTLKGVPDHEKQPDPAGGRQPGPPGADTHDTGREQRPQ